MRFPVAFNFVRRGPEVEADAGFIDGSMDRLNLVVCRGKKQSLLSDGDRSGYKMDNNEDKRTCSKRHDG
jgi:hypothetical protein